MKPELIVGDTYSDVRGTLRFCNDFDMSAVRRFYTVANRAESSVRGWIGHRKETKWFFPLRGKTTIVLETMDVTTKNTEFVQTIVDLKADNPSVLKVAPGNWFCIKQDGRAEVMVFSDCKIGEFENDDFRKPI